MLSPVQFALGGFAGSLVGFTLGLVGGGGSILAVPLIVYLVGVSNPHVAIGTSAFAVAVNAGINLATHARARTVRWPVAALFAAAGVVGAMLGSTIGKAVDGQKLLAAFALLMLVVGVLMLRSRRADHDAAGSVVPHRSVRVSAVGGLTGLLSGFFGIGGGFLVVPGLMYSARLPILYAVGSSLIAVAAFGLTTAINYARAGWVDWPLAGVFIGGGIIGGVVGARLAHRLSRRKGALNLVFAALIFTVAIYMLYRSGHTLGLW
ncbi:sulfite exporter TauE/SafE family protein [Paraburkholderia tropica]|uniref:sulfite exporter TauE/SafE family protein n=1 Tax=Paraburkholderia tropica TaxID=92647 RepID=UPI002AB66501|nr:sulfite exporter TauE/SafE family protein [Paraburkholderia tropica]